MPSFGHWGIRQSVIESSFVIRMSSFLSARAFGMLAALFDVVEIIGGGFRVGRAHAGAVGGRVVPGVGGFEIVVPEGPGTALHRSDGVNHAAGLSFLVAGEEGAIVVKFFGERVARFAA